MNAKRFTKRFIYSLTLLAGILGCSARESASSPKMADQVMVAGEPVIKGRQLLAQAPEASSPSDAVAAAGTTLASLATSQPDRYLIKNARVSLEVEDARKAADQIVQMVQGLNGYVGEMNERADGLGNRWVNLQARVPSDQFDKSLQQFETTGKVLDKQVTSQDVTEEYVDTDARTRNLKHTEERLIDHLNRTARLEDILAVERELSRVREEIERLEGRLRFLGNRVSFSTIAVTLQEKAKPKAMLPPESYSTGQVASEATRSLVAFARVLWTRLIWVGVWSAVWLPLLLIVWTIIRRIRKRHSRTGTE
ncbi:MAG: DUF4349 domain-containing protein [Candidatus Hydrogenedentes bacterium]|nr:DUF4349 domain-containing protein [Candidatus Hydrogenedentota bacterium]